MRRRLPAVVWEEDNGKEEEEDVEGEGEGDNVYIL